jgi:hypothetical protein
MVAKTGLIADGFSRPARCHLLIKTSPEVADARTWLVIAIITTSRFEAL